MENENKLAVSKISMAKDTYCSLDLRTNENKKALYNATEQADILLNDIVGTSIELVDVYVECNQVTDEETGEVRDKYRSILFDANGKTYATGAYGVYNSLRKIFACFGTPDLWESPLIVEVQKRQNAKDKNKTSLTLIVK